MKKLYILLSLSLFCQTNFAAVSSQLDATQVAVGDRVTVTFTTDSDATDITPDFSSLSKDFEIHGATKSTQLSIINGASSVNTKWGLAVSPKHTGQLTIPAITFGKEKSKPLQVNVSKNAATKTIPQAREKIFIETKVDNLNPYIQSQVTYNVKLYYTQNLSRGLFIPPHAENAIIMPVGNSQQFQEQKNGMLFKVLEQHFAVFPQKSGQIRIAPPQFKGSIVKSNYQDIDDFFQAQKPIKVVGNPIELKVAAIPSNVQHDQWLPTSKLTLTESWDGLEQTPQVGQALTRHIIIKAEGLTASQLPSLIPPNIAGANVYPEKNKTQEFLQQDKIVVARRITFTYIPTKAGNIHLPEIKIPWWNTATNRSVLAMLPARDITIFPGKIVNQTTAPMPAASSPDNAPSTSHEPAVVEKSLISYLPWLIMTGIIILWLITLYLWRHSLKKITSLQVATASTKPPSIKKTSTELKQACANNQAKTTQNILLSLMRLISPQTTFNNLSDIQYFFNDPQLSEEINKLNAAIYSPTSQSWSGKNFWNAWQAVRSKDPTTPPSSPLPSLNFEND